jgi:arginase
MNRIVVLDAPSILGLRESGVEFLPNALRKKSLVEKLGAEDGGKLQTLSYSAERDKETKLLNPQAIHDFSVTLADRVEKIVEQEKFPLVLGGDCSIIIGNLLALRRRGRYGLFFMDGHADFYQPEISPTGEVADMDLGIVAGYGPDIVTNIENLKPLVKEEDVVLFGFRDYENALKDGSRDVLKTKINCYQLKDIESLTVTDAAKKACAQMSDAIEGVWIHLDVDVLNDKVMPAVDYRMPGGLYFNDLEQILKIVASTKKAVGMSVAIFNPTLDPTGEIAQNLVKVLAEGLKSV